jgi:hypothetical protein
MPVAGSWSFTNNQFLSSTVGSYIRAQILSTFTDGALFNAKIDPIILAQYNFYHPLHLAYESAYNIWDAQRASQAGGTITLEGLLEQLSTTKIKAWDIQVQGQYARGTAMYKTLFPHGHKPFHNGSQMAVVDAVSLLNSNLTGIVPLAATKTDVGNFLTSLKTANTAQKGMKQGTEIDSSQVEIQRVNICNGMYAVLGALMNKYYLAPEQVESFFDLKTLQSDKQLLFKGHVSMDDDHVIARRTFDAAQTFHLNNLGNSILRFYLATHKTDGIGATFYEVPPMTNLDGINIIALGDPATQHYLCVHNPDHHIDGQYEVGVE